MSTSEDGAAKPHRRNLPALEAQAQILDAVDDLFYREGARAVGVDAVVKRAGVNKMSLYRQFESKDALLLHYLERREERFWTYIDASLSKHPGKPKEQLLQLLTDVAARAGHPDYRGCPFVNIAAEFPDRGHQTRRFVAQNKQHLLERLITLCAEAGVIDPQGVGRGLALLLEGAYAASQTYDPSCAVLAALPHTAACLIEQALP